MIGDIDILWRRACATLVAALFLAGVLTPARAAAPAPLSDRDAALYQEIFELQEEGDWPAADAKIKDVENDVLMGYVKRQRLMHPTDYRSGFRELKAWMAYYADHPNADKVYRLAMKRRPKRASAPVRPRPRKWRATPTFEPHPALAADYAKTSRPRLAQIEGRVRYLARREEALKALNEIERRRRERVITDRQFDRMRTWIAASLYYQGYVDKARDIAEAATDEHGDSGPLGLWIAGLIAYREGDIAKAHERFAQMAKSPHQEDTLRAGAGFWAARTALASGRLDAVAPNLEIAANHPFTFYGQLALAQLGRDYAYRWTPPKLSDAAYERLAERNPAVRRAAALAQVGRASDADLELRWLNGAVEDADEARDLLALAAALDLPAAQLEIASHRDGDAFEAGLYPVPDFAPTDGFTTDRAILFALMRKESKFKADATSRVGARGLMQLMPRTASFIAKDRSLATRAGRDKLYNPGFNLAVGQQYVNYLIEASGDGGLFDVAAAYNGGPGNLRRWKQGLDDVSDPLLFIESLPSAETRDFVESVLTNIWIYRARLGQPAPSRDRVAAGGAPIYEALDALGRR